VWLVGGLAVGSHSGKPMSRAKFDVDVVRDLISGATVGFGIPAYNEGDGILPTLRSLWEGLVTLRLTASPVILSDSYDEAGLSSAPPASLWAHSVGARLEVDSADRRRSLKEAVNVLFDRAETDVLILVNADVLVPTQSLVAMLHYLFAAPRPVVAIGSTLPDPAFSRHSYRAGAWQLRAVTRAARLAPLAVGPKSFRAEGAFWGVWHSFYSTYRHPIGSGSLADDIELTRAVVGGGYPCLNAADAFVYKVPPGSLVDLCSGTVRGQVAMPERKRGRNEHAAALIEAGKDPLGAVLYVLARIWCRRSRRQLLQYASEHWRVSGTTKRRTTND
jgi:hypothetical protein